MRASLALHHAQASATPAFGNSPFAETRCILRSDTNRALALLRHCGVVDDQHRIVAADEPVGLNEQFRLQRCRIPDAISDEMAQLINALLNLGYAVRVLRDDDKQPDVTEEKLFLGSGGIVSKWLGKRKLEQELFRSLPIAAVQELVDLAIELHTKKTIDDHIKSVSNGTHNFDGIYTDLMLDDITDEIRDVLGNASSIRNSGWFKSVSWMEKAAREIVGPALKDADESLREIVVELFSWISNKR